MATYDLRQTFRYQYPGPISRLRHRLVVAPPAVHGDQRLVDHDLRVTPVANVGWSEDAFGNRIATIEAPHVDAFVEFAYRATIVRAPTAPHRIAARALVDSRYREPTNLTYPSSSLRDAAAALARDGACGFALAAKINAFVADYMQYAPDSTSVLTTAQEAFAQAKGVCQDYAHVMVTLARACGLAARYVSGHLIGEGGTHAWVEIIGACDDGTSASVWAFDPTHRRRTTLDYVFVAAGSDYADVAPTSGSFVAPYIGAFSTDRFVERLSA